MRLLILTAFYPVPNGTHERMFVHVRNKYYAKHGTEVTVLNFACKADYVIDGIQVICLESYEQNPGSYDIAVCHSANVRNHYRFLKKYEQRFPHIVFFFHGHEVLYLNRDYPRPYDYMKTSRPYKIIAQNCYDKIKMSAWAGYYRKLASKSEFVFVSNWLFEHFKKNLKLTEQDLMGNHHVINNSIGEFFETAAYNYSSEKKYDFITIRSNLDGSKYCIDTVVNLAERYPEQSFLIIGQGRFFEYHKKPDNVDWISHTINHEEMKKYLDLSKCGLLLTKQDTQGVMACEFAAYGIPTITSDIDVCREIFGQAENVALVPNGTAEADIIKAKKRLIKGLPYEKDKTYFSENTIAKEMELYMELLT